MKRSFRFGPAVLAAIVLPLAQASAFAQCAMCRAALLGSREGAALIAGLRQGIVLLLAIPLIITALVLIRIKRAARQGDEFTTDEHIPNGASYFPERLGSD